MKKSNIGFPPKGCFWAKSSSGEQMLYMERCPNCGRENYAPMVATGICAWCGWDVNKNIGTTLEKKTK